MNDAAAGPVQLSPSARRVLGEIRRLVLTHQLKVNTPLPSVRALAARTGLSSFPIQQALKHIEREGWARRENGQGRLWLVPAALERAEEELHREPPLIINIVSPLHHAVSYEYAIAGMSRRLSAFFSQCSTRQVYVDVAKGHESVEQLLAENRHLPNEMGYLLSGMPGQYHALFRRADVPCVVLGHASPNLNLPCVYEDMNHVGYMAGRMLCPHGPVLTLHFGELIGAEVNLIDGVRRAAREVGVPEPRWEQFYRSLPENPAEGETAVDQLLRDTGSPVGILAMRLEIALLIVRTALRRKMRIPNDVQVIGYGAAHHPIYELAYPGITSIGPKSDDDLARRCADLLARSLGQRPELAAREMVESALVERQTTRPR